MWSRVLICLIALAGLAGCSNPLPNVSLAKLPDQVSSLWRQDPGVEGPQKHVDQQVAEGMPPHVLAVGDTGQCDGLRHPRDGVMRVAEALAERPGLILLAGDLAYPDGRATDFSQCFDPALGALKPRILPVPGNHEYRSEGAGPYFDYFGSGAGPRGKGWYSVNFARWHIVALNTNVPAGPGSEQYEWLKKDLKSRPKGCVLAFFHHPRFSSGGHGDNARMDPLWRLLADAHADIAIAGDDHHYERFVPLNAEGVADAEGIRQFVVGTGGIERFPPPNIRQGSEVRSGATDGILDVELREASFTWRFIAVGESDFEDRGSAVCHARP